MQEETEQAPANDEQPKIEPGPTEKMQGDPPPGQTVPGAQNPDSTEIKKEINPNTE